MGGFAIRLEALNRKLNLVLLLAERAAGVTVDPTQGGEGVAFQYPGEYNKDEGGYQGSAQGRVPAIEAQGGCRS